MSPFYSFNPNPLRYTNNMADKACHVVGSTTQVGLTQALDFIGEIACICKEKSEPSRLLQRCSCLHFLRLAVAAVVQIGRAHVCTPVTNAPIVCRLLLAKKKTQT